MSRCRLSCATNATEKEGAGPSQHGGSHTQHLLRGVAATSDLLKGCIRAREALGAAKTKILRAREEQESRKPPRPTRPMMVLHGGSWGETGGAPDWREWGTVGAARGAEGERVAAAMQEALPLAEEFSEKMLELAGVVPELSRSLVSLTEVKLEGRWDVCSVCPSRYPGDKQNTLEDEPHNGK